MTVLSLSPDLDQRVTSSTDEPLGAGAEAGGPADRVAADGVGVVDLLGLPGVVGGVGEDGDGAVAGAAHKDQTMVMGSPLDAVHTRVMVDILMDLGPLASSLLKRNIVNSILVILSSSMFE